MNRVRSFLIVLFLVAVSAPACGAQFSFAAFGDVPYNADEEPQLVAMIGEMNRHPLAFVMHVGDFKDSRAACTDELYLQRLSAFSLSHHPFVYIPGDNEWSDCGRSAWDRRDPLERLSKLRQTFFPRDSSLGQRPLRVERQTAKGYPEHLRWISGHVVFATLNVPGPDNNRAKMPEESKKRTAAVGEWMRDAFRIAREQRLPAIVLALQANIWPPRPGYDDIVSVLTAEARRYSGEVLVVHGDTHWFRFDQPLADPRSGERVANVTRLEVYGSPFVNWIHVTIRIEGGKATFEAVPASRLER